MLDNLKDDAKRKPKLTKGRSEDCLFLPPLHQHRHASQDEGRLSWGSEGLLWFDRISLRYNVLYKNCQFGSSLMLEWETTVYFWTFLRLKILLNPLTYSAMKVLVLAVSFHIVWVFIWVFFSFEFSFEFSFHLSFLIMTSQQQVGGWWWWGIHLSFLLSFRFSFQIL